jgi:hypothetical protein
MSTESFLATPHAMLHIPRCVSIAQAYVCQHLPTMTQKRQREVGRLIAAAKEAEYQWQYGPDYRQDEAAYDRNVAAMNAAGKALLDYLGVQYD